jgi:D-serine deaminase-like pyridoxal phosphate-dependent protein
MDVRLETYKLENPEQIITPALLIYPEIVDKNIRITLGLVGNDPNRWRPHIKTAKLGAVVQRLIHHGIHNFKCATTLELLTACRAGAADVLVAFAMTGANARRVRELAQEFRATRISVLVESAAQVAAWRDAGMGVFIDVNPGMNRTGVPNDRADEVLALANEIGADFRGLHWYDGQISTGEPVERTARAHEGYDKLLQIVGSVERAGISVEEVITSGTPVAPYAFSYKGFVTTVISHPLPQKITCDAGHKSVSADAGVPTCAVVGHPELTPQKPSEEHLPIDGSDVMPRIGDQLYLIPRHVCPSVNNFDEALMVVGGRIAGVERVTARGHENPIAHAREPLLPAGGWHNAV